MGAEHYLLIPLSQQAHHIVASGIRQLPAMGMAPDHCMVSCRRLKEIFFLNSHNVMGQFAVSSEQHLWNRFPISPDRNVCRDFPGFVHHRIAVPYIHVPDTVVPRKYQPSLKSVRCAAAKKQIALKSPWGRRYYLQIPVFHFPCFCTIAFLVSVRSQLFHLFGQIIAALFQ